MELREANAFYWQMGVDLVWVGNFVKVGGANLLFCGQTMVRQAHQLSVLAELSNNMVYFWFKPPVEYAIIVDMRLFPSPVAVRTLVF